MNDESKANFDPYRHWLQIPDAARPPTHYQMLGIAPSETDPDVIRQAKMMRAAYLRNFQSGEHANLVAKLLGELETAASVLADPFERSVYDAEHTPAKKPAPVAAAATPVRVAAAAVPVRAQAKPVEAVREPPRQVRRKSRAKLEDEGIPKWLLPAMLALAVVVVGGVALRSVIGTGPRAPQANAPHAPTADRQTPAAPQTPEPVAPPPAKTGSVADWFKSSTPPAPAPKEIDGTVFIDVEVFPHQAVFTVETDVRGVRKPSAGRVLGMGSRRTLRAPAAEFPLAVIAGYPGYRDMEVILERPQPSVKFVLTPTMGDGKTSMESGQKHIPEPTVILPPRKKAKGNQKRIAIYFNSPGDEVEWRYTTTPPAGEWQSPGFDDSAWSDGLAPFGAITYTTDRKGKKVVAPRSYGPPIKTDWRTSEIWLRKRIELPKEIVNATVKWVYFHKGFMWVYVNGKEEMANVRGSVRDPQYALLTGRHFVEGENVIAVRCYGVGGGGPAYCEIGFEWQIDE